MFYFLTFGMILSVIALMIIESSNDKSKSNHIISIVAGSIAIVLFSMGLQSNIPIKSDSRFIVKNVEYSSSKG